MRVELSVDGQEAARRAGPAARVTPDAELGEVSLRLAGELDVATAGQLAETMRSLPVEHLRQVRLDLSDLAFLDAAGLTALLRARALIRACDGRLVLDRPAPPILRLLAVTDLTDAFDIGTAGPVPGEG
jgi:anti-sigma B factor antagonist